MALVSCYQASKIANVSKQAISDMKKKNDLNWGRYPFFVIVPPDNKVKVDTNHPDWFAYIERNQDNLKKKNRQEEQTESKSSQGLQDNSVDADALIRSVLYVVGEKYSLSKAELKKLTDEIDSKYTEITSGAV